MKCYWGDWESLFLHNFVDRSHSLFHLIFCSVVQTLLWARETPGLFLDSPLFWSDSDHLSEIFKWWDFFFSLSLSHSLSFWHHEEPFIFRWELNSLVESWITTVVQNIKKFGRSVVQHMLRCYSWCPIIIGMKPSEWKVAVRSYSLNLSERGAVGSQPLSGTSLKSPSNTYFILMCKVLYMLPLFVFITAA